MDGSTDRQGDGSLGKDGLTGRRVDGSTDHQGDGSLSKEGLDKSYFKIVIVFGYVDRLTGRQVDGSTGSWVVGKLRYIGI